MSIPVGWISKDGRMFCTGGRLRFDETGHFGVAINHDICGNRFFFFSHLHFTPAPLRSPPPADECEPVRNNTSRGCLPSSIVENLQEVSPSSASKRLLSAGGSHVPLSASLQFIQNFLLRLMKYFENTTCFS